MIVRPTLSDFEEFSRDYETTNTSFLYIAKVLKDKGIKNYDFMLVVKNEDVIGLNPYSENLSVYEKKIIAEEVQDNYFYYLREVARIPVPGSSTDIGGGDRFKLHRGNLAFAFLQEMNQSVFGILPRQTGKTWAIIQRLLWVFNFATTNSQILFMHFNKEGAVNNLKRLKEARELIPIYLQNNLSRDKRTGKIVQNIDNVNQLRNSNKNEIITKASAKTRISADTLGRGMTQPIQFYDEFAFTMFNKIIWESAIPAYLKAADTAKRYGKPFGIQLVTTPGLITFYGLITNYCIT